MSDERLELFAYRWRYCWACGIDPRTQGDKRASHSRRLEIHHICKHLRVHEEWNLSRLCSLCHKVVEGWQMTDNAGKKYPQITSANVFWLKRKIDPRHFDWDKIEQQWRVGVPDDPEVIDKFYQCEFLRFTGGKHGDRLAKNSKASR